MGLYFNLIFTKSARTGILLELENVFKIEKLYLYKKLTIKLNLKNKNGGNKEIIQLIPINDTNCGDSVCNLELEIDKNGSFQIWLNLISITWSKTNLIEIKEMNKWVQLKIVADHELLWKFRMLNLNRKAGLKMGIIITEKFYQSTLDFDRTNVTEYGSNVNLVDGFIDKALNLSVNHVHIFRNWFVNSCVRLIESCYFGITLTLWLTISEQSLSNMELISTGKNGLKVEINTRQIILYYQNLKYIFHHIQSDCFTGKWCFIEIGIFSQLGLVELFINQQERDLMVTVPDDWSKGNQNDQIIVGPANGVLIDEIRVADVDRRFLYGNGYISRGPTNYKLLSFTRYQQNQLNQYKLHGSADLVHTDYGQGLSLSQFGHRWVTVVKYPSASSLQRRGWMVRLWLRPDNVGQSRQVWLDIPWLHLLLESDMEYLVGTYKSMLSMATMVISSRTVLHALQWTLVELSWRQDDGLRMIVNGRLIGHSRSISKSYNGLEDILGKEDDRIMTLGSINFPASGIIDDLEIFDADRTNLAYDRYLLDQVWCTAKEDFNQMSKLHFGVVGTGHCTTNQNVSTNNVLVTLPNCFDKTNPVTGCRNCWSIRFWLLLLDMVNSVLLTTTSSSLDASQLIRVSVILKGFSLELGHLHFWCELSGSMEKIMKRWRFIEISWDEDEGLLMFIDRALIECECLQRITTNTRNDPIKLGPSLILFPLTTAKYTNQSGNSTNSAVGGCIDELEVYRNRLSILYRTSVINDEFVRSILRDIRDRELLRQRIETLLIMKESGKGNVWEKKQDVQLQFVGDRHGFVKYDVKYDSNSNKYPLILSTQQVNIVFSVDRLGLEDGRGCVLWANEYDHPPITSLLLLKKDFLVFSRSYSVSGFNETRFITEEIQIKERIVVGLIYEVAIIYQFDKISVDVKLFKTQNATNTKKSQEHIIARQKPLLPNKSVVFLGGYKQYLENINSSFAGTIYEASINTHELEPPRDLKLETITSLKSKGRSKVSPQTVGNIRIVHKTLTKPIDVEMRDLVNSLTQDPVTVKFTSPFNQLKFVFSNFSESSFLSDLTGDIRFKFSTYYSRGLVFFMGNRESYSYLALEIFDSTLYFVYKSCLNNSAIMRQSIQRGSQQHQQQESLDGMMKYQKPAIYTVIIYKDASGTYNLLVNEVLVLRKICLSINNQSIIFGYYGDGVNDWPAEIYSRIGFVGCLLYVRLGDVGFVNITRETLTSFVEYNPLNQSISTIKSIYKPCNLSKSYPPNECFVNNQLSNKPCRGGFCRPMEYLSSEFIPQTLLDKINLNLVQCDCLSSARHRDSGFQLDPIGDTSPTEINEYNRLLWLLHQRIGRDIGMGSCSIDDTNFYISQSSSIQWTYTNTLNVPNTFDMDFSMKTYLSSGNQNGELIAKLVFKSNWFIIVFHQSNHSIGLKIFHGLIEQNESHISIGQMLTGIWHIIRIQIKFDRITLIFDTFSKDFNLTVKLPPLTDVIIGGFPDTLSNTWVRKVTINSIPIVPQLQNLNLNKYFILIYTNYIQPQLLLVQSIKSITLLNNHKSTIMKPQQSITSQSSLITLLSITLPYIDVLGNYSLLHITTTNHYSLFLHLSNHNSVVQLHCLYTTTIAQIYRVIPIKFYKTNSTTQLWITINLIENNINITLTTSSPATVLDPYLLTNKIQDIIWPFNQSLLIILGSLDNSMPPSVYGCIKLLSIYNSGTNIQYRLIHNPLKSAVIGQCKNVSICNVNSCESNGICYHDDGYSIKCRCIHRNSSDTRCQYQQTTTTLPISTSTTTTVDNVTFEHAQICPTQYYGGQCVWRGYSRCVANLTQCHNGGWCYVNITTYKSLCNCELTLFRGSQCQLDEIGFNPSQNGVVVMTQPPSTSSSGDNNGYNNTESFRMLLQLINETDKLQSIMTYRGVNGVGFKLIIINNTLNLIGSIHQHNVIGYMKNTNILLITYDKLRVKYLFNGKYGELQWKFKSNHIYRFRRDIRTSQIIRETNIGCDKLLNNCFTGLIGGFTWNEKSFLDSSNTVIIKGDIKNISQLILIKFPQIYVANKSETNYWRYFFVFLLAAAGLLILSLVITMLILILKYKTKLHTKRRKSFFVSTTSHSNHNINNIRYNDDSTNIELEPMIKPSHITANENTLIANVSNSSHSPAITNKNKIMYKPMDQLLTDNKIDLIPLGTKTIQKKLILIKQAHQVNLSSLQCYDLLVIPHTGDLMIIVDWDCNFQNSKLFYPTVSDIDKYECHRINLTSDHKYLYASVTSPSSTNRNEYILLIWSLSFCPAGKDSSLSTYGNGQIASVPPFLHALPIDNYRCSTIILTMFADCVLRLCIFDLTTNSQVTHSTMFANHLQYHNVVSIRPSIDLNYILLIMSHPTHQIMVTTLISNKVSAPLRFGSSLAIQIAPVRKSIFYILLNDNKVIQVDLSMETPSSLVKNCLFDNVIQMISGITNDDTRRIALLKSDLTINLNLNTNLSSPVWLHLTPAVSNQLHQKDVVISFSADCTKIFRLYNRSILLNVWSLLSNESTSLDLVNGICKFYRIPNSDAALANASHKSWCSIEYIKCHEMVMILTNTDADADAEDDVHNVNEHYGNIKRDKLISNIRKLIIKIK